MVGKNGALAGFKESLKNTIQEVTYFLVLGPLGNYTTQFGHTIVESGPLIMQRLGGG